jgi:diaminopimelate decarboxylase
MTPITLPARVHNLAERLGRDPAALPAYVYDLAGLAEHVAHIKTALGDVRFRYAVKANPDPEVLRTVARDADGLEVSSGGERRHAAAVVPGANLAFGGPGKTPAELAEAVHAGTARFHVESPHELRTLAAVTRAAGAVVDVLLRVNLSAADLSAPGPGEATGETLTMGGTPTSFGMDEDVLDQCGTLLTDPSLGIGALPGTGPGAESGPIRLRGLHAHLASGYDAGALLRITQRVVTFGREWCARHGVADPEFNLGGGMAVDYARPGRLFDWDGYGRGLAALARPGETLWVEPGRSVTAYCGWYVTVVLDVKRSHGQAFAIVAGGTHHLRTPAAKGHDQPCAVIPETDWAPDWAPGWPRPGVTGEPVTITGQLCTPKDVLARQVPLPRLHAGDLVVFGLAGAYAWNISHHDFLMHPPPAFHHLAIPYVESRRLALPDPSIRSLTP